MKHLTQLVAGWDKKRAEEMETIAAKKAKSKKEKEPEAPAVEEEIQGVFDNDVEVDNTKALFGDDSEDSDDDIDVTSKRAKVDEKPPAVVTKAIPKEDDLFGDTSDEESDEELIPGGKRSNDGNAEGTSAVNKKRRVQDDLNE